MAALVGGIQHFVGLRPPALAGLGSFRNPAGPVSELASEACRESELLELCVIPERVPVCVMPTVGMHRCAPAVTELRRLQASSAPRLESGDAIPRAGPSKPAVLPREAPQREVWQTSISPSGMGKTKTSSGPGSRRNSTDPGRS